MCSSHLTLGTGNILALTGDLISHFCDVNDRHITSHVHTKIHTVQTQENMYVLKMKADFMFYQARLLMFGL